MGGRGSGPRRLFTRRTVENCHSIGVKDLQPLGLLKSRTKATGVIHCCSPQDPPLYLTSAGVIREDRSIPVQYSINVRRTTGILRLSYQYSATGKEYACDVRLVTTPCHFSGVRWWLQCPLSLGDWVCRRRVSALYLTQSLFFNGYFGCRECHSLTYTSTQNWDSRVQVILRSGLTLPAYDHLPDGSVADLLFRLKVLDAQKRRLKKAGWRLKN